MPAPPSQKQIPVPFIDGKWDLIPWDYPPSKIPPQANYLSRTFSETCALLRIARKIMELVYVYCVSSRISLIVPSGSGAL
jgi:hypothetical protein